MSRNKIEDGLTKWQRYRLKDIDEYRKRKKDYAKTPDQQAKRKSYMKEYEKKVKAKRNYVKPNPKTPEEHNIIVANRHLEVKYGINIIIKNDMVTNQNGLCLICNNSFKNSQNTHVDHCHETGKVQGILCGSCNTKLGWYEKNKNQIEQYLN